MFSMDGIPFHCLSLFLKTNSMRCSAMIADSKNWWPLNRVEQPSRSSSRIARLGVLRQMFHISCIIREKTVQNVSPRKPSCQWVRPLLHSMLVANMSRWQQLRKHVKAQGCMASSLLTIAKRNSWLSMRQKVDSTLPAAL